MPEETDPTLDSVIETDGFLEAAGAWPGKIPQLIDDPLVEWKRHNGFL